LGLINQGVGCWEWRDTFVEGPARWQLLEDSECMRKEMDKILSRLIRLEGFVVEESCTNNGQSK
jgi:hypothetical protein